MGFCQDKLSNMNTVNTFIVKYKMTNHENDLDIKL